MKVEEVLVKLGIQHDKPKSGWIWAKCPWHEDSDPSWRIRITNHRYGQSHCFSCKNGGTLIDLVMHVRKCDFIAARDWLGSDEPEEAEQEEMPDTIRIETTTPITARMGFQVPREVIFEALELWPTPPRLYLEKRRGVTAAQVSRFGIGYALSGKLTGRIVLPVWTKMGEVTRAHSYMARDFTDDPNAKRYLYPNSLERPNGDVLFGEICWHSRDTIIVTEGAFNALAWERATSAMGICVGALSGSYVRPMHILKLSNFKHVIVASDADPAGDRMADEIETSLARHTKTTRVRLPKDADETSQEELWNLVNELLIQV